MFLEKKAGVGFPGYTWDELAAHLGEDEARIRVVEYSNSVRWPECDLVKDYLKRFADGYEFWIETDTIIAHFFTDMKGNILNADEKYRDFEARERLPGKRYDEKYRKVRLEDYKIKHEISAKRLPE